MGQKLTEKLPVEMTEKELNKAAKDLVETEDKVSGIEEAKSTANSKFKADIELLEEAAGKLRTMIRTGCEERDVECEVERDFNACEIVVRRLDTKEVVTRRTMTAEERQKDMFDEGPAGKKKGSRGKKAAAVETKPQEGETKGDAAETTVGQPGLKATVGELAGAKEGTKKAGKKGGKGKKADGAGPGNARWPGDENKENLGF